MVSQTFERRDPTTLKNHLLSISIYGQHRPSDEFLQSVADHGIIEPLVILPDGVVIAGHTRKFAAFIHKLKDVPCVVRHDLVEQPLVVERLVIMSNRQRLKTGDVIAREAAALAEIESKEAALRQSKTRAEPGQKVGSAKVVAKAPPPKKLEENAKSGSKTRDVVAESLGVGVKKAAEAIKVGNAIKSAEAKGDTETVEKLTTVARDKSIHAAAEILEPKKAAVAKDSKLDDDAKEIEKYSLALAGLFQRAEDILGQLFNAVDRKKQTNGLFASKRHSKFEKTLRELGESISECQTHCATVETLWSDTKLQGAA